MNRAEKRRNKKLTDKGYKKTKLIQSSSPSTAECDRMRAIQKATALAVQYHQAGDLLKAESIYQQILQSDPNQPIALHLLGLISYQAGKNNIAINLINKAIAINPDYAEAHCNLGNALQGLGKLDEAVESFRKAVSIKPDYAEAHSNLGNVLQECGEIDDAVASYKKAITIEPDHAGLHNNLGNALFELGKLDEALESLRNALTIAPDSAETHSNLGNVLQEREQLEEALASYNKSLAIKPSSFRVHFNLGNVLQGLGQLNEAEKSYNSALTIKPDFAEAHNNLGIVLQDQDKHSDAFIHFRSAIKINPKNDKFWLGLANSLQFFIFTSIDEDLLQDLLIIINLPTVRPSLVINSVLSALGHHADFSQILTLAGSHKPDSSLDFHHVAVQLSRIPLFLRLITLTHIIDLKIERMLTTLRRLMLQEAIAGKVKSDGLPFASALALHCFTNEYVFAVTDEESLSVEHLQKQILEIINQKRVVPPPLIVTLGAYIPLHKFDWAQDLTEHEWSKEVSAVIERQILEPSIELSLRSQFPCLTPLKDTVSRLVRDQYEEYPYPRWIKTKLLKKRESIGAVLRAAPLRFDLGDYETPNNPEILIAGCGTGQHSIYTASRFKDARVLAIDLSLSSLSYAARKTNELAISNIEYAQADIVELGKLDRQFDLIESVGVLHHLGDPMEGWKVLVDRLNSGGLMKIGLYSETARQHIVSGRSVIAEMGYTSSAEDIRRCRQDFIAMANGRKAVMTKICNGHDFFSLCTCHDLLFHVQEHRFTIPQIIDALDDLNLKFLGFEMQDTSAMARFKETYPEEKNTPSLALWHEFEQQYPDSFNSMYQFWCQKS